LISTARAGAKACILLVVVAALELGGPLAAQEPVSGIQAEEAADFARRAALAALHGPPKVFLESLDADGILRRLLGSPVWSGLTGRQQTLLRTVVREHFAQALAPLADASAEVAWASVADSGKGPVLVDLGLRYGSSLLKTRWTVDRTRRGSTIEDVVLVDPGISLAREVGRVLGPEPVRQHDAAQQARSRALPRLFGFCAILGIALVFTRRLPPERRRILWLTASVPALLFLVDGALAVHRALSEPYALVENLPPQPWRQPEKLALAAQKDGRSEAARSEWSKAIEAGAPAGPVYYQMGLAARARGGTSEATQDFERALAEVAPAPGAARELATMALSDGRLAEARSLLQKYLREAGPDPDSLATLAVVETGLGDTAAAVATMQLARALVGENWKKAELEARIYARSGNAAAAVAALRPLESEGKLDRAVLRAEPAYLPIATDPAWVEFLAETAK
jgi:tetratricopeptide (TPR) repeat protein